MKSRFVADTDDLTKTQAKFERWLLDKGYVLASDCYPGAIEASSLVADFLSYYPIYKNAEESLYSHAEVINWISDYDEYGYEDEDDRGRYNPKEEDWI